MENKNNKKSIFKEVTIEDFEAIIKSQPKKPSRKKTSKKKNGTIFLKDSRAILRSLDRNNETYRVELTNSTTIIKANSGKYIVSDSKIPPKELNFIQQVKKYALKLYSEGVEHTGLNPEHISYFNFYDVLDGIYYDIHELDVNGAYWEIAYILKYISKEIYLKGLTVDKKTRLVALGSMASTKKIYEVSPEKGKVLLETICNETTRSYFFHIAKYLDDIIQEVVEKVGRKHVYFYWVDAMFIDSYAVKLVHKEFEKRGLKMKEVKLASLYIKSETKALKNIYAIEIEGKHKTHHDIKIKPFSKRRKTVNKTRLRNKFIETLKDLEKLQSKKK